MLMSLSQFCFYIQSEWSSHACSYKKFHQNETKLLKLLEKNTNTINVGKESMHVRDIPPNHQDTVCTGLSSQASRASLLRLPSVAL